MMNTRTSRRAFIHTLGVLPLVAASEDVFKVDFPILDLHQHTNYSGRSDLQLRSHQKAMGIQRTVLLPAGKYYGLAAQCGSNASVYRLAELYPDDFVFFANEVPDLALAKETLESYLALGAVGIGEQKFELECDARPLEMVAALAADHGVPVLIHFQHNAYNTSLERFHTMLEKFPHTNFIGHAQTWWGNIDRKHSQSVMYPVGPVTPGGLTDRLLADYPNMYGDLSAGSGLNALLRDEVHARGFLERHQDKLLYGSDCNDTMGRGPGCQGTQTIRTLHALAGSDTIRSKIFYENAARLLRL
ncbi:MAG: amidohydrolase family protein [Verrucomicrobiota bacterium]|nr:amidohydrolase family protein [Verrucomicrobiota bacterium]